MPAASVLLTHAVVYELPGGDCEPVGSTSAGQDVHNEAPGVEYCRDGHVAQVVGAVTYVPAGHTDAWHVCDAVFHVLPEAHMQDD